MANNETTWKRMSFKGKKVWVATDQKDAPVLKNEKVLIKYQLDQDYEYLVHKAAIGAVEDLKQKKTVKSKKTSGEGLLASGMKNGQQVKKKDNDGNNNTILIYTDGATSGNPGPSGIGIFFNYKKHEKEISKYIGVATNNIAELEAIRTALMQLKKKDIPVKLFTDSSYAHGVLTLGWKTKKNIALVNSTKKIILQFKDIKLIKVKGHAGNKGNEKADLLATTAIKTERLRIVDVKINCP